MISGSTIGTIPCWNTNGRKQSVYGSTDNRVLVTHFYYATRWQLAFFMCTSMPRLVMNVNTRLISVVFLHLILKIDSLYLLTNASVTGKDISILCDGEVGRVAVTDL